MTRSSHRPQQAALVAPAAPKPSREQREQRSNLAAIAVLGGRFVGGVVEALKHPDFVGVATRYYVDEALKEMRKQPAAVAAAVAAEEQRMAEVAAAEAAARTDVLDAARKGDAEYVAESFSEKLLVAAEAGMKLSKAEVQQWAELFSETDEATLRAMSYRFQYAAWVGMVARAQAASKSPSGNAAVKMLAVALFGEKAAWSERSITDAVKKGDSELSTMGRPCSFPKELEEELIVYISKLRQLKVQVYKPTVLYYAMGLIGPTEFALGFARIGDDGEYVRAEAGGFEWDTDKLDHWYYRRFLGDHPELTTGACAIGIRIVCFVQNHLARTLELLTTSTRSLVPLSDRAQGTNVSSTPLVPSGAPQRTCARTTTTSFVYASQTASGT
jgi:hypothetical protein